MLFHRELYPFGCVVDPVRGDAHAECHPAGRRGDRGREAFGDDIHIGAEPAAQLVHQDERAANNQLDVLPRFQCRQFPIQFLELLLKSSPGVRRLAGQLHYCASTDSCREPLGVAGMRCTAMFWMLA